MGGPKWDDPKAEVPPEQAVLGIRKSLGLYANLRPVKTLPALIDNSTFKPDVIRGVDLLFVRELTGGTYFAKPKKIWETKSATRAVDTTLYTEQEIERAVRAAFELAKGRRKKVTSVDKANVMATSRLWRIVAERVAAEYPDVEFGHMLADSCAMHLTPARPTSTWWSPTTCSAICSRTWRRCWAARSGCCHRRAWGPARRASTSRSTARRRTSPARGWRTRWRRS